MQFRYVRGAHARALNTRARGRMRIGMNPSKWCWMKIFVRDNSLRSNRNESLFLYFRIEEFCDF